MIHNAHVTLRTREDWKEHAPPKSASHWKPGRSAVETARAWLEARPVALPLEVGRLLDPRGDVGPGAPLFETPPVLYVGKVVREVRAPR